MRKIKNILLAVALICMGFAVAHRIIVLNGVTIDLTTDGSYTIPGVGGTFTLTTTGSSGPSTYSGGILNIPQYAGGMTMFDSAWVISKFVPIADSGTLYVTPSDLSVYATTAALHDTALNAIAFLESLLGDSTAAVRSALGDTASGLRGYYAGNPYGYITGVVDVWGIFVTSNNHIAVDSTLLETKLYALKQVDSIAALIPPTPTPYSLTTTGSSGAATLTGHTFNIPNYTLSGLGGIGLTALSATSPLSYNNTTGVFGITQATTSANGYLSSTDWNTFNNKGSGTVTSIKVVSNVAAYSVTPTTAVTSTGVYSFMATGAITQLVRGDGSLFNIGSNGYVLGVVSGSLSWVLAPSSGGVTVGGTQGSIQFDNAGSLGGAAYCFIASDGNFIFSSQSTAPSTPATGYAKVYSNNGMGEDDIHVIPSLGGEYILQASLSQHRVSKLYQQNGSASLLPEGTDFTFSGGSIYASVGAANIVNATYDATNALPNIFTVKAASTAAANSSAGWYYASSPSVNPVLLQNTAYSGATRLTVEFGLGVYASTERIFIGYNPNSNAAPTATTDPSANINIIGLSKDVADGTFQFLTNGASGTAAKINTGITPNQNNWYRLTIFLTPAAGAATSTGILMELDVMTKSAAPTVVYSGAITTKIPGTNVNLEPVIWVNSGSGSASVAVNFIQMLQERFW